MRALGRIPPSRTVVGMGVFLLIVSLIPTPDVVPGPPLGFDKLAHFVLYAVFAFLIHRAMKQNAHLKHSPSAAGALSAVAAALYGLGMEGLQAMLPYRSAETWDAVANALGALIGGVGLPFGRKRE